jgi:hypothetical protein
MRAAVLLAVLTLSAHAQWTIQHSNTTADLRGIDNVGHGIAWASGTNGTVLHTTDNGATWLLCKTPPDAEHLDFRGIQAFDANTAIVMSSGKGDLSRLYKTTDGCNTWKLLFTNPYSPDGFFDTLLFIDSQHGILLGDPSPFSLKTPTEYENDIRLRVTADGGVTWGPISAPDGRTPGTGLHALGDEAAFAASNSSIDSNNGRFWLATSTARVSSRRLFQYAPQLQFLFQSTYCAGALDPISHECGQPWTDFHDAQAPINHSAPSAGIFSIHFRTEQNGVVVGGNYSKPDDPSDTAAYSADAGLTWFPANPQPRGYRSSVAYDPITKTWITVGPNGTDVSTDDGRTWRPLHPDPALHQPPDADRNWNALSLPFVVGPHGRIAKLNPHSLAP